MSIIRKRISLLLVTVFLTSPTVNVVAAEATSPYECTPEELQIYINNKTETFSKNSTELVAWGDFKEEYIAQKEVEGKFECRPFWQDIDLDKIQKKMQDQLDQIKAILDGMSNPVDALIKKIIEEVEKQLREILNQSMESVCERLSKDNLKDLAEKKLKKKTGLKVNLDDSIMDQIVDQTICRKPDRIDVLLGQRNDRETCDMLGIGVGSKADKEKAQDKAIEAGVKKQMDKLEEKIWGSKKN